MKLSQKLPRVSREARLAIVSATLAAIGAILLERHHEVFGAICLLLTAGLLASFYFLVFRPAQIPSDAILTLRIAENLREDAPRSPLEQLRSRGAATLYQLRRALEAARRDTHVKTVLIEIVAPSIGLAVAEELHDLLRGMVAAGKRVVAIVSGDNLTLRDYLVACGASEIVVNPDTGVMMLGVAAGGVFLKEALSRAGIEAQTLQWKEYKGAAETFTRNSMSPQLQESLEAILTDWKTAIAEKIASARRLTIERARELSGSGFLSVAEAIEAGLVDRAGYLEDLRDELDPEHEHEERFVSLSRYLHHVGYVAGRSRRSRIALIHGLGPIVTGEPPVAGEFISGEKLAEDFRRVARDDRIRAIVLRVNSPGGSAVGSDLVWRAIAEARKRGKPVIVSMGDVAGSGGYYVAMGADAIVAEPTTVTGSIGVVYTKFSVPHLLQRIGVNLESTKSDPVSDALSIARTMTESELAQVNKLMAQLYANFTAKVAEGRKLAIETAEPLARGRVWSGVAAKANGLIDELGGLNRAIEVAREKAGMTASDQHELVPYPPPGLLASMSLKFARAEASIAMSLIGAIAGIPQRWVPAMIHLASRGSALQLCGFWPAE